MQVTLLDFSSAWSREAESAGLYGSTGPTRDEETVEYMPPERLLDDSATKPSPAQDAWAIGVVLLEVLLGTRQAFQVDPRTRAFVEKSLRGRSRWEIEKALLEAALADLCVLPKDATPCAPTDLLDELQERDPLEVGFASYLGVDGADFVSSLLARDPSERALPSQALDHPFLRRAAEQLFENVRRIDAPASLLVEAPSRALDAPFYTLPGVKRKFEVWESCRRFAELKNMSAFCEYDATSLPPCLSAQRFEIDQESFYGLCDLRGRRARIEDHHAVVYDDQYALWGVFDGHGGRAAARYAARELPAALSTFGDDDIRNAFHSVDQAFDDPKHDKSGSTATVAVVVNNSLVVANVGDSRAIACCPLVVLTEDHVASDENEALRIKQLGGTITERRVEDRVVLTRSIGNRALDPLLIAEPYITRFPLSSFQYLIVATDGLWDVVANDEAVRFVGERLDGSADAAQRAAKALAHEALVRQSTDNVCVIVVDLEAHGSSSGG